MAADGPREHETARAISDLAHEHTHHAKTASFAAHGHDGHHEAAARHREAATHHGHAKALKGMPEVLKAHHEHVEKSHHECAGMHEHLGKK